jgi:hypothetical protein
MVKREGLVDKLVVKADGSGQVGHAGSALLVGTADRVGLTRALSVAWRWRVPGSGARRMTRGASGHIES